MDRTVVRIFRSMMMRTVRNYSTPIVRVDVKYWDRSRLKRLPCSKRTMSMGTRRSAGSTRCSYASISTFRNRLFENGWIILKRSNEPRRPHRRNWSADPLWVHVRLHSVSAIYSTCRIIHQKDICGCFAFLTCTVDFSLPYHSETRLLYHVQKPWRHVHSDWTSENGARN